MSADEIEVYKRNALIQKSVDEVKQRAQELEQVRLSPKRYKQV